jgi:hypothetical protein
MHAQIIISMAVAICCTSCSIIEPKVPFSASNLNNLYKGESDLVRIRIDQLPNSPEDSEGYSEFSHPAGITYFFRDGKSRVVEYSPQGEVLGSVWSD